jgi:hypothetical protein
MFNSIGDYTEGKRYDSVAGRLLGCAIGYDTGQLWDPSDPAAICFALDLDRQNDCAPLQHEGLR